VIIEDIYHNRNFKNEKWMARLSGAVIKTFDTEIKFYQASQARRLAGIKGTAHKAEIQIYVLDSLKKANTTKFKKQIEELNKEFDKTALSKQIRKTKNKTEKKKLKKERTKLNGRRKYRLNKLSKLIEKETGYSEHICDAIILGKAYRQEQLQT
jgi:predicted ATPase with chaperone activity